MEAHKAEDKRRERRDQEAKAPRVEEVNPDMEVEEAGDAFGVNVEAGKKRNVVRS